MKLKTMTTEELRAALNNPKIGERRKVQIALRLLRHEVAWARITEMARNAGIDWPRPK
jgi:hypothetical protein